jgi:hypothetical protein
LAHSLFLKKKLPFGFYKVEENNFCFENVLGYLALGVVKNYTNR